MKFARRRRNPVDLNLTPLIDVVFLLLIFFMVSTTFTKETQLQIDLPKSSTATQLQEEEKEIVIEVNADNSYAVNSKALINRDIETLRRAIQEEAAGNTLLPVRIRADANSSHQAVVTAMDVTAKLGFSKLRIGSQQLPPETP